MELNVIIAKGNIETLVYYMDGFVDYCIRHNISYYIIDYNDLASYNSEEFEIFLEKPNVVVFAFNNYFYNFSYNNNGKAFNIWKYHNIPYFDYVVDHPRNFYDTMEKPVCDLYVFSLDRNHAEFIKKWYPKVKKVYFSPNGGFEVDSSVPYEKRPIDVIVMTNCQGEIENYPRIAFLRDGGVDFYIHTLEIMYDDTMLTTERAIERYFYDRGIPVTDEQLLCLNKDAAGYLENTVRRTTKLNGLKALDDAGINVDVYGGGYTDSGIDFSDNVKFHGRIPVSELMPIIGQAKISLCFMPWFKAGSSEKNFDSMLNGALCVTDRSNYLEEQYIDGFNIVYYNLSNPAQMAADVKWLLDNVGKAKDIARRGYDTAICHDTWAVRYDFVIEKMREVLENRS